jgi:hypothetical protein
MSDHTNEGFCPACGVNSDLYFTAVHINPDGSSFVFNPYLGDNTRKDTSQ